MVRTVLQSAAILKAPDQCPVARSKQRTAFPPNYIHSLDSSHMMMTASECSQAGARTSPGRTIIVATACSRKSSSTSTHLWC